RQVTENLETILALEAFCAAQGIDFRKRTIGAEKRLGRRTRLLYDSLRSSIPFIEKDDYMKVHIDSPIETLRNSPNHSHLYVQLQALASGEAGLLSGTRVELQKAAMKALMQAVAEAGEQGLTIGPRGADSARRRYKQTVDLWASRVVPGMKHWVAAGKITQKE